MNATSTKIRADYVTGFDQLGMDDISRVGGKNASLGEMIRELDSQGIRVPGGFALECQAMKRVRDEMGLTNVKFMIPFCRTVEEGRKVKAELKRHGLVRGENGLELYVRCEIPSNVILAEAFATIFDGFSIGSNDLTQLTLGIDRDSEIVSHIFDERDPAVKAMIAQAVQKAKTSGSKIGICGQAPGDLPEFTKFLVELGIDSISVTPDVALKTKLIIAAVESELLQKTKKEMSSCDEKNAV